MRLKIADKLVPVPPIVPRYNFFHHKNDRPDDQQLSRANTSNVPPIWDRSTTSSIAKVKPMQRRVEPQSQQRAPVRDDHAVRHTDQAALKRSTERAKAAGHSNAHHRHHKASSDSTKSSGVAANKHQQSEAGQSSGSTQNDYTNPRTDSAREHEGREHPEATYFTLPLQFTLNVSKTASGFALSPEPTVPKVEALARTVHQQTEEALREQRMNFLFADNRASVSSVEEPVENAQKDELVDYVEYGLCLPPPSESDSDEPSIWVARAR